MSGLGTRLLLPDMQKNREGPGTHYLHLHLISLCENHNWNIKGSVGYLVVARLNDLG